MAKAHRGDKILNGRTHWQDWDPRFMSAGQRKPDDALVDEPEPRDRLIPVTIKTEAETVSLKTESQPVTVKMETKPANVKTESQPVRIKIEELVTFKTEPDTEGSGITVPSGFEMPTNP
ncbi:uncharacterized protein B0T23DRAFT_432332 [Neurospora hispaniola]|uniref:Uncharacterized protein n=1 Tax=Neurospora hispaniola TaxID=588809 RepID=A0AAJ0MM51_9PEZI|nr:hypothetical protein B0T23DRAFT_432332 [Neurospora hispaniola]